MIKRRRIRKVRRDVITLKEAARALLVFALTAVIGIAIGALPVDSWVRATLGASVGLTIVGIIRPGIKPGKVYSRISRKLDSRICAGLSLAIAALYIFDTTSSDIVARVFMGVISIGILWLALLSLLQTVEKLRVIQLRKQLPDKVWEVDATDVREALETSLHS